MARTKSVKAAQVPASVETQVPPSPEQLTQEKREELDRLKNESAPPPESAPPSESEQGKPPRRKYRRRRTVVPEEPETPTIDQAALVEAQESFGEFADFIFSAANKRIKKPFTETEQAWGKKILSRLVKKYFPLLGGYDVEIEAGGFLLLVVVPRLLNREKKSDAAESHIDIRENRNGENVAIEKAVSQME